MTDILKRLNTVVIHAERGVDPYWVEIAGKEIQRLRELIEDYYIAMFEFSCECEPIDCLCYENNMRAAERALFADVTEWDYRWKDKK